MINDKRKVKFESEVDPTCTFFYILIFLVLHEPGKQLGLTSMNPTTERISLVFSSASGYICSFVGRLELATSQSQVRRSTNSIFEFR